MRRFCSLFPVVLCLCAASGLLSSCDEYVRQVPAEARPLLAPAALYGGPVKDDPAWGSPKYGQWFKERLAPGVAAKCRQLPALDRAAAGLAVSTVASDGLKPTSGLTDWILWRLGVPYVADSELVMTLDGVAPRTGWRLKIGAGWVKPWSAPCAYGVARPYVSATFDGLADVVVYEAVDLDPFPKLYKVGQPLVLSGHSNVPLRSLRYVADAGNYERAGQIPLAADGSFRATIPLPHRAGRWMVQLETLDPSCTETDPALCWPRAVADFPVYVDAAEPSQPADLVPRIEDDPDEAVWPVRLVTVFNAERARLHLKPLALSRELAQVAGEEADALYKDRRAPPAINVAERVAALGLKVRSPRQSAARIKSINGWLASQLLFPVHRARLVDPAAEYLGIALKDLPNGETELVTILAAPDEPDLNALVQLRARELAGCYDEARQRQADANEQLGVRFSVSPAGSVGDVAVSGETTADAALTRCVQDRVHGWTFEAHPAQTAPFSVQLPEDLEGAAATSVATK